MKCRNPKMASSGLSGHYKLLLVVVGLAGILLGSPARAESALSPITAEPTAKILQGKMVWADLLTNDIDAAADFYRAVFGWSISASADSGYLNASLDGELIAAISSYQGSAPDEPGIWLASLSVESVDAAMKRGVAQGGVQLAPGEDLPGRGRVAVLQDPQGAVVGVMRATGGDPADGAKLRSGDWIWPELWSPEPAAIVPFYRQVFGYEYELLQDDNGLQHHVLARDNIARASVVQTPLEDVEPNWLLYLLVDDMEATLTALRTNGGKVLWDAAPGDAMSDVAIIMDPTGGVLGLQARGGELQ